MEIVFMFVIMFGNFSDGMGFLFFFWMFCDNYVCFLKFWSYVNKFYFFFIGGKIRLGDFLWLDVL